MAAAGTAILPEQLVATPATGVPRQHIVAFILLIAFFVVGQYFIYPLFLMKVLCFALFAGAFNLLLGYGGLVSFGHAAFLGSAGYVSAHAAKVWGFTPELAILAGTVTAAALGLVIAWLAIRRQGIYFAMITLAVSQMVFFFCLQASFTHGEDGIQAVPRGKLLGLIDLSSDAALYWFVLGVFILGFLLIYRIIHSPYGRVLVAIKENEPRAVSLGYRVDQYKLLAFVLSAAISGLAGSTKVFVFKLASLTDVTWQMSGEVILITLLGGLGTIFGPVVGSFIVLGFENYLSDIGSWFTIAQGAIFILCVLVFRRGVIGEIGRAIKRPL